MTTPSQVDGKKASVRDLPRNVWAVSLTSFLMDISSEMVINILPLFLSNVLGVKTNIIGVIEGVAEATASILKLFSGWLSDRVGRAQVAGGGRLRLLGAHQALLLLRQHLGSGGRRALGRPRRQGHPHRARATRWWPTRSTSSNAGWPSAFTARPTPPAPCSA